MPADHDRRGVRAAKVLPADVGDAAWILSIPIPTTVVGAYKSDAFYPSPLVLNITGMDRAGNLSGSMWGMETKPQNGEDPAWQYWHRVFGRDARGTYRGGRISISFSNGASYTLDLRGNELSGTFATKTSNYPVSFLRNSYGVAAR